MLEFETGRLTRRDRSGFMDWMAETQAKPDIATRAIGDYPSWELVNSGTGNVIAAWDVTREEVGGLSRFEGIARLSAEAHRELQGRGFFKNTVPLARPAGLGDRS